MGKRILKYQIILFVVFFLSYSPVFPQSVRPLHEREFLLPFQQLPYNRLQIKVARYQDFNEKFFDQPFNSCMGLELDVFQDPKEPWNFFVSNGNSQESLSLVLRKIRDWSDAHPGHFLLTIYLKINQKSCLGDDRLFSKNLDALLAKTLSIRNLFVPAYLQRDAKTLLEGVRRYGWPSLSQLRTGFLVILSGDDTKRLVARRKMVYTYTEPYKRIAFVDIDQGVASRYSKEKDDISNPYYQEGSRVFIKLRPENKSWQKLASQAHKKGFVCHVKVANSPDAVSLQSAEGAMVNSIMVEDAFRNPMAYLQELPQD